MSKELWATYSVKDHLQPRALAADVMLFDRLVFPVPEDARFPENSGLPNGTGPVDWTSNPVEWARWQREQWDPDRQHELLEILNPVSRKVSWDPAHQRQWRGEAATLAAKDLPDWSFVATRTVLTRDLPSYVTGVAAMGPSYRSVDEIERELGIREVDRRTQLPSMALTTVLGWEFLTPDDDRLSDEELLKETVAFVAGDTTFQRRRRAFLDWQQGFLMDGRTDRESIERAVTQMRGLLDEAKAAAQKLTVRKVGKYVFRLAPSALGLALAAAGVPSGIETAAGAAFLSLGGWVVDEWLFKSAEQTQIAPTAFVQHARRHFGWK
jgi:hypothetical protein